MSRNYDNELVAPAYRGSGHGVQGEQSGPKPKLIEGDMGNRLERFSADCRMMQLGRSPWLYRDGDDPDKAHREIL